MPDHDLSPYEIAYLFGGADRVAVVALVVLHEGGRIRITPDRHRVYAERRTAQDPIETVALAVIPDIGRVLGLTRLLVALSPAVAEVGWRLRDERLLPSSRLGALWQWRRIRRGRSLRRRLAEAPQGLVRVAVQGTAGIADDELREIFETHVYTLPKHSPLTNPKRDRPVDPLHGRTPMNPATYDFTGGFDGSGGWDVGGYGHAGGSDGGGHGHTGGSDGGGGW
ncbi:TIGR04222 domain-containing membrane protein [Actinoallomurus sp. CA-150999]|uniref:TIGR04222 domain-containing membrane protein n=1 Tax=Actinoallomurus sp. CA-150999 TaxID=3239887 RepID=UPI003D90EF90